MTMSSPRQKTRNSIPEPILPETRILFMNFGPQSMKLEIISGNSCTTFWYSNYPNPARLRLLQSSYLLAVCSCPQLPSLVPPTVSVCACMCHILVWLYPLVLALPS
ncbi:hypothetical protein ZEAMMB73_Zm00001d032404 [Zea mays]|uniref:Uncharacterized protein n=1 Tax=Zea mays TaxID=4577 RepID=A0A1D6KQH5_MAIZE|nr:hypothetical protein ZEAMMB73_Zm00001d032404 [Zea mays]ONM05012.1 hypothetical protein ZEAMMB73_Zm00001d032404 [Zea mays]